MNISGKIDDFTFSSSGEDVENVLANQWPGKPSWISNLFNKIQPFFRTSRETIVVSLEAVHAVVLKRNKGRWTPDAFLSEKLSSGELIKMYCNF